MMEPYISWSSFLVYKFFHSEELEWSVNPFHSNLKRIKKNPFSGNLAIPTLIFEKFIATDAGGEWYERLDREGNVLDGALAHSWKINYHTVRSMIQTVRRLRMLVEQGAAADADRPRR